MKYLSRIRTFSALLVAVGALHAGQVRVAVEASMAPAVERIVSDFQRETGHEAVVALGSPGRFYAQLRGGASFEVLLAADESSAARLEQEGLTVPGTRFTYAVGRLA